MFIMPNEAWSAILGATVGALITYKFAVTLADRQFEHLKAVSKMDAWHVAAREFIAALAPDLKMLEEDSSVGNLMDFLRQSHRDRHMRAAASFEHFLTADRGSAFNAEWQRYCYGQHPDGSTQSSTDEGLPSDELLFLYCESATPPPGTKSATEYVVQRLHTLLSYAKET